ncbi:MAG: hypothetical protein ABIN89_27190 [Chitinophagaceae bacterium]
MKQTIKLPVLLAIVCIILISCKKVVNNSPNPASNKTPVANAGDDQTFTFPIDSTLMNGSLSSDPDGTIVSYQWNKISGPSSFTIITPPSVQTKVNSLVQGVYQFELKVTDNGGLSARDTVQIIVTDSLPGREFVFSDLIWDYDYDGAGNLYIGIENMPELFSSDRLVEVSLKRSGDNIWIAAEKFHYPNTPGYVYSIYSQSLFVFFSPHIFPWSGNTQLAGTKVSLRVKFL